MMPGHGEHIDQRVDAEQLEESSRQDCGPSRHGGGTGHYGYRAGEADTVSAEEVMKEPRDRLESRCGSASVSPYEAGREVWWGIMRTGSGGRHHGPRDGPPREACPRPI